MKLKELKKILEEKNNLTGYQISWLTGYQISWLTESQIRCLTGDQIRCLTESQISWLKNRIEFLLQQEVSS